jgi:hypothetical protein
VYSFLFFTGLIRMCCSLRIFGGGWKFVLFSAPELASDKKSSTEIEGRFFAGERRGVERRGGGGDALGLVVPPLLKAAMSWIASSSELILAT